MFKFIVFAVIGWFIYRIFRGARFLKRKSTISTPDKGGKSGLKLDKDNIEDADFDDLD